MHSYHDLSQRSHVWPSQGRQNYLRSLGCWCYLWEVQPHSAWSIESYRVMTALKAGQDTTDKRGLGTSKWVRTCNDLDIPGGGQTCDDREDCRQVWPHYQNCRRDTISVIGRSREELRKVGPKASLPGPKLCSSSCCWDLQEASRGRPSWRAACPWMSPLRPSTPPRWRPCPSSGSETVSPGLVKAWVQAPRNKTVIVSFDYCGPVNTHKMPKGKKVNSENTVEVMKKFLKIFHQKRTVVCARQWVPPWGPMCCPTPPGTWLTCWLHSSSRWPLRFEHTTYDQFLSRSLAMLTTVADFVQKARDQVCGQPVNQC